MASRLEKIIIIIMLTLIIGLPTAFMILDIVSNNYTSEYGTDTTAGIVVEQYSTDKPVISTLDDLSDSLFIQYDEYINFVRKSATSSTICYEVIIPVDTNIAKESSYYVIDNICCTLYNSEYNIHNQNIIINLLVDDETVCYTSKNGCKY